MPKRRKTPKANKNKEPEARKADSTNSTKTSIGEIRITDSFNKDLGKCSLEDTKKIAKSLEKNSLADLFQRKKLSHLITFKERKIWYFQGGEDIRITCWFDDNNNLYLLSIESHDSLKRAHKKVIHVIRQVE